MRFVKNPFPFNAVGPNVAFDGMDKGHFQPAVIGRSVQEDILRFLRKFFPGSFDAEVENFGQVVIDIAIAYGLIGGGNGAAVLGDAFVRIDDKVQFELVDHTQSVASWAHADGAVERKVLRL